MGKVFIIIEEKYHMKKVVQTAGRNALGTFAPDFAHYIIMMISFLERTGIIRTLT